MLLALLLASFPITSLAQEANSARTDVASYEIEARLDPATKQIHGSATITYRNPSRDTLGELWLKLYLNAFRSSETVWMREARRDRLDNFDPGAPGWVRVERLVDATSGANLLPPDAAEAETAMRVPLPSPLGSGETIRLETTWTSQLPRIVARTGFEGDFVIAGQWYPKLAVYDRGRWDAEPWHANAEFFADFGSYTLDLTVPVGYVTGASGTRWGTIPNYDGTVTTRFHAESVSDIAWTAWPGYRLTERTVQAADRTVQLELLTPSNLADSDERYFTAAQVALDRFGRWFGPYPWPRLTLVVPPPEAAGADGMEYPMLVTLDRPLRLPFGLGEGVFTPEIVTLHEIAHQWFPLQVATDEAREAWLDEGLAEYATIRALGQVLGPERSLLDLPVARVGYLHVHRLLFALDAPREPLNRAAWEYPSADAYGAASYSKGALALLSLERTYGEERFLAALRLYVDRWRWRHPTTADLQAALSESLDQPLDWFFDPFVYGTGSLDDGFAADGAELPPTPWTTAALAARLLGGLQTAIQLVGLIG